MHPVQVAIYLAETKVTQPGARVLDVTIDGEMQGKVDIYAASGGPNTALVSNSIVPSAPGLCPPFKTLVHVGKGKKKENKGYRFHHGNRTHDSGPPP